MAFGTPQKGLKHSGQVLELYACDFKKRFMNPVQTLNSLIGAGKAKRNTGF
jgi:hypothetical protein